MNVEAYENLRRKQFKEVKAYAVLILFIVVSMGYFSITHYKSYKLQKQSYVVGMDMIEGIKDSVDSEKLSYNKLKKAFDDQSKGLSNSLQAIFPDNADVLGLTKKLDKLEMDFDNGRYGGTRFSIPSINYSAPQTMEDYSVLPFVLSISTSYDKLMSFLRLVETSGSLDVEKQYRLMDIDSINLTLPQDNDDNTAIMNFSVRINAYFQKEGLSGLEVLHDEINKAKSN